MAIIKKRQNLDMISPVNPLENQGLSYKFRNLVSISPVKLVRTFI